MDIGYIITLIVRIFALIVVGAFSFYMFSLFKKVAISKKKALYRILIVIVTIFVMVVTLLPRYYILSNKLDVTPFDRVIEYAEENKGDYYSFHTKKYSGYFKVKNINELEEYQSYLKEFTKKGVVFKGSESGISWMSAPIIAKRDLYLLGYCWDTDSAILLWNDEKVVYLTYWYEARGIVIRSFTFPELFYKETIDLNKIIENAVPVTDS